MRCSRVCVEMFVLLVAVLSLASSSLAQAVKTIYSFDGMAGSNPFFVTLVQGRDGFLYGTTVTGGANGFGTVFKTDANGNVVALHSFTGSDGEYPWGGLTLGTDGLFYGTTAHGGTGSNGEIFRMTPQGTIYVLYNFTSDGLNGAKPSAPPIQASDGNFYGTTEAGGTSGDGVVYKLTSDGVFSVLFNLTSSSGTIAQTAPAQGQDGNLFLAADLGGGNGCGSVIKLSLQGVLLGTFDFDCVSEGGYPTSVSLGRDGSLYGNASYYGNCGGGVLYKLSTSLSFTALYQFGCQSGEGYIGFAGPTQATDGNLYGANAYGGAHAYGSVFEFRSPASLTTLFSWPVNGANRTDPYGALAQHTDGDLFGVTYWGGNNQLGSLYRVTRGIRSFVALVQSRGGVESRAQILGQGFTGTTSITFNGVEAASFNVASDTFLTAIVPTGATAGPVVVTTPGGTLTSSTNFQVVGPLQ